MKMVLEIEEVDAILLVIDSIDVEPLIHDTFIEPYDEIEICPTISTDDIKVILDEEIIDPVVDERKLESQDVDAYKDVDIEKLSANTDELKSFDP